MLGNKTLAVIMTCYNRKNKTLQCLRHLTAQTGLDGITLAIYLVDDGSTDGTSVAVSTAFPDVKVITGTGSLFWCKGMRLAWQHAAEMDPVFYLLLNDDTLILPGAITTLLAIHKSQTISISDSVIVVGACKDTNLGIRSYGGQIRCGRHPLVILNPEPNGTVMDCDTFQGNCVLVPRSVYKSNGTLDEFQHGLGDTDYGYRAKNNGSKIVMTPDYIAYCDVNPTPSYWWKGEGRWKRWKKLNSRKGLPFSDWLKFARRHGGIFWWLYWPRPYLRILLNR